MTDCPINVLDASVGVKWFKGESGHEAARALYIEHMAGRTHIMVSAHFLHEVVATIVRRDGVDAGHSCWKALGEADLTVVGLDDRIAEAAFAHCRLLGCSFYDALPAAVAHLSGGTLYSADRRAHATFEGVVIIE